MIPFLKLSSNHSSQIINLGSVLKQDIIRWLGSSIALIAVAYGIGALVAGAGDSRYPIGHYAQITFMNTPIAGLALIFFTCILMFGFKKDLRFWSIAAFAMIVWFSSPAALVRLIDDSGMSIAALVMLVGASLWRIWDYIDLKFINKLDEPRVTSAAIAVYVLLLIASTILLLPVHVLILA